MIASNTGLVLLEGLPGSGKSTTAHLLCLHMGRHGQPARWIYEHETPHPIFDRELVNLAIDEGRIVDGLYDTAVHQWRRLAERAAEGDHSIIIESAFFQLPIHPMLLLDWPEEQIAAYLLEVERAIGPARPTCVLLRHGDIAAALRQAFLWRGAWFEEYLEQRIGRSAFARARGLTGAEGIVPYFTEYCGLIDRLLPRLTVPVVILDAGLPKETLNDRLAEALQLPAFEPFPTRVAPDGLVGRYLDPASDSDLQVATDGTHLYLEDISRTRLIHLEGTTFEIVGVPVRLTFVMNGDSRAQLIDCQTSNLPNLPRQWVRSA